MAQKFIINNNKLIYGNVRYHNDLLVNETTKLCIGGGFWDLDPKTNTMYFYGESQEFGKVTLEEFEAANKESLNEGMEWWVFSNKDFLHEAIEESKENNLDDSFIKKIESWNDGGCSTGLNED